MAASRVATVLLVLSGIVAGGAYRATQCPDHDASKCRDNGNDCCIPEFWPPEGHSCADGYTVVETNAECTTYYDSTREYSCIPPGATCNQHVHDCHVSQGEEEDWWAKMLTGTIVGCILAIILIIVASMPVCCGIMKENKGALMGIGICVGIFATFCFFIPLIAALAATSEAVDNHCDKCGCTEQERSDAQDIFGFWGAIIGYFYGFGWLCVVLAIAAEVLVCCMCCPCCGPLKTYQGQSTSVQQVGQVQQVPGMVVGQQMPMQQVPGKPY